MSAKTAVRFPIDFTSLKNWSVSVAKMVLVDGFSSYGSDVQSIATKSLIVHDGCAGEAEKSYF